MKKSLFFAAALAVAAIFASCESKEPTAVLPENMNDSVIITGYVRYTTIDDKNVATAPKIVDKGTQLTVLYGVDNAGKMSYVPYYVNVDENGFYRIALGCAAGKQIDEVKVECSVYMKDATYAPYTDSDGVTEMKKTDAYFYGTASQKPAIAHNAYGLDIIMTPQDNTSKPGMN